MNVERDLKRAIRSGDAKRIKDAFESFYNKNVRLIYRVLIDNYGKDDELDDDIQESFLVLLNDPVKLLSIDRIDRYWIGVAKITCVHRLKRASRLGEIDETEIADSRPGIPELVQGDALSEQIIECLGHPDADIVILRVAYGYSEKEIAERLNIGEDAISYRYRKGLKLLKRRLGDEEK